MSTFIACETYVRSQVNVKKVKFQKMEHFWKNDIALKYKKIDAEQTISSIIQWIWVWNFTKIISEKIVHKTDEWSAGLYPVLPSLTVT